MLATFASLKGLLKLDKVDIDNTIFLLHYKATVIILIVFSLIVTSHQYIGDPIDCIAKEIPAKVMDTYCWIHSTYTVPNRMATEVVGIDTSHPGVRPQRDGEEVKLHKYYQWVCFVLFAQAILFYLPRFLWKIWEGGKMKSLVLDLNCPIIAENTKTERKTLLIDYFTSNLHSHNAYAIRFFICELLNLINVIAQVYLIDRFLDGEFTTYGWDVLGLTATDPEYRVDPMSRVFPTVTKCSFHKFGVSGTVERIDSLCVLPVNIVNEKIYVFLWFWFFLLGVLTALAMIYRLLTILAPPLRRYLLRSRAHLASRREVDVVAHKCQIGDWFVLRRLGKNIEPLVYKEFISDLACRFEGALPA